MYNAPTTAKQHRWHTAVAPDKHHLFSFMIVVIPFYKRAQVKQKRANKLLCTNRKLYFQYMNFSINIVEHKHTTIEIMAFLTHAIINLHAVKIIIIIVVVVIIILPKNFHIPIQRGIQLV
jgi:hypothetical protein